MILSPKSQRETRKRIQKLKTKQSNKKQETENLLVPKAEDLSNPLKKATLVVLKKDAREN